MPSTKSQLLSLLKRQGRCTVDELAAGLGLAAMTVRQHLAMLERDDMVSFVEERRRTGRPHYVYSLTEQGEESFSKRFDRMAIQLLREVGELESAEIAGLSAEQKRSLLFDKHADRFIDRHLPKLQPLSISQRVMAVAEILQAEGGFAEWAQTDDGLEIRDYNCFYRKLCNVEGGACRWHVRVLAALFGCMAESQDAASQSVQLCRFVVRPEREGGAAHPESRNGAAVYFGRKTPSMTG